MNQVPAISRAPRSRSRMPAFRKTLAKRRVNGRACSTEMPRFLRSLGLPALRCAEGLQYLFAGTSVADRVAQEDWLRARSLSYARTTGPRACDGMESSPTPKVDKSGLGPEQTKCPSDALEFVGAFVGIFFLPA